MSVTRQTIEEARRRGLPVVVDPKSTDLARYRGATVVTPNLAEFRTWCTESFADDDLDGIGSQARRLAARSEIVAIVVTLGAGGMIVGSATGPTQHVPGRDIEVFDVTGAGDTVVATIATATAADLGLADATSLANLAGSLAVSRAGTAVIGRHDLATELDTQRGTPSLTAPEAAAFVAARRARGARIVFTNGCFDLLHEGHVAVLRAARAEGDLVVVGVNSDESVRRLKGPDRPFVDETSRAMMLAELRSVDAVVVFDEDDPGNLIELLQPDVLVKGGDYEVDAVVGRDVVVARGGRVVIVPLVEGRSTTALASRITNP